MRHLPEKQEVSRRPGTGRLLCVLLLTPFLLAPSRSCADAVFGSLSRGGSSPPAPPPAPDTEAPRLVSFAPQGPLTRPDTPVTASFSESMDPASFGPDTFYIHDSGGGRPAGRYGFSGLDAEFTPDEELPPETAYFAFVTTGLRDLAGNALEAPASWSFTTGSLGVGRWQPMSTAASPPLLEGAAVVWTGTEMVVYGVTSDYVPAGGRYDPVSDTWTSLSTAGAHAWRYFCHAWTGTELVVWGGVRATYHPYTLTNGGARYHPATDTWRPMSTIGAPSPRYRASAAWTGTEVVVWGGEDTAVGQNTGGRYDPVTDTWRPTTTTGAPASRSAASAFWTGSRVIICNNGLYRTGWYELALYDPLADHWTAASTAGAPEVRHLYLAVWTGTELIMWGGFDATPVNTGGRYNPVTDTWRRTSTAGAPSSAYGVAVWTGDRMAAWGGLGGDYGALYDPVSDTWQLMTYVDAPPFRLYASAVWTGAEMVIWGGGTEPRGDRFRP